MMRATLSLLLVVFVVVLSAQTPAPRAALPVDDVVRQAVADYRDSKYEPALATLRGLLSGAVEDEQAVIRLNAGLCALRLLRSRDAEELLAPLVEDPDWAIEAAFLLGLASSQHAERAVVAAQLADAEPMAWTMATRAIRSAEAQFRSVVAARPDWRPAVRNLERLLRRRTEIERLQEAAQKPDAKQESAPKPEPPKPAADRDPTEEVVIPEVATAQLTAKELAELQERVRKQQSKKLRGRQQRSRQSAVAGERDW